MNMPRLVLAACLLAGAVPLRAQTQPDGLDPYAKEIQDRNQDPKKKVDGDSVRKGELKAVASLCAMKKLATAARGLTEVTVAYADAYDKAGGNESAADDAAQKVIKKQAAQAARSAVWSFIKSKIPYKAAVHGADTAKGTVAQAAEGVGVGMCAIVAQKLVRGDFGGYGPADATGDKMIDFKKDAGFKEWIAGEHAVTEQWLREQNGGGDLKEYQKSFLNGYTDKLTSTYSDLKCTYFAFYAKGQVPKEEKDFCRANVSGKNPLKAGPAS